MANTFNAKYLIDNVMKDFSSLYLALLDAHMENEKGMLNSLIKDRIEKDIKAKEQAVAERIIEIKRSLSLK